MDHLFTDLKTSQELRHSGTSEASISRQVASGKLMRLCHNTYVDPVLWRQWDATTQCLAHHVAFLKTSRGYVLSHTSAALWWGAPLLKLPPTVWASHPRPTAKSRKTVRVSRGRPLACEQAVRHRGVRVTTPLQTALDCTRVLPLPDALCIADYMLHHWLMTKDEFAHAVSGMSGRGVRTARDVVELMSAAAESCAETLARYHIVTMGFVLPLEQVTLWTGEANYRPDFVWEEFKVILEVDGMIKYTGAYGRSGTEVIRQERYRQRQLEKMGYTVVRVQWEDVAVRPENLRELLLRAGVRLKA